MSKYTYIKFFIIFVVFWSFNLPVFAETPKLQGQVEKKTKKISLQALIDEALEMNPEILAAEAKLSAAEYRIPQAKSFPDPQVTFGYQSDTFKKFDLTEGENTYFITQLSQTFPFFGKRKLKGQIAKEDVKILKAELQDTKLKTTSKVKELYYDLFLAYKNLDILTNRTDLFAKAESAATARYSTGLGEQQDVLLAQTEKYNILVQQEQLKQKIQSLEAELNALLGHDSNYIIEKPDEPVTTVFSYTLDQLIQLASKNSPEITAKEHAIAQQNMQIKLAKKDYLPDFSVNAGVFPQGGPMGGMWMASTTFNIPIYYRSKQRNAVREAEASAREFTHNLDSSKLEVLSSLRDNYSVITSSDRLMRIYKNGLISRSVQDFELAITGYATGRNDALTAITTLKNLIDYETSYWEQFVAREKAIAKIESIAGITTPSKGVN